jgi:D-threo-aldose 1-dehydrogenase
MPFEPTEHMTLGRTGLEVTRLGFGAASIGGLFAAVSDDDAIATVEHAWDLGIRTFDVAPLYGYGAAERRVGMALADRPRDEYILSTKVGRLVRGADSVPPGTNRSGWCSTTAPTASAGRSRRASGGSTSSASISP